MENYAEAFIEIPKGSSHKYEYDLERKVFVLDRPLFSPMFYPAEYGFIPETIADDGDPMDIMVLMANPTFPGCLIRTRVIGMFLMEDEKGNDEKIIAVPNNDPRFAEVSTLDDVGAHTKKEFEHFFSQYKQLEGKEVRVRGWGSLEDAMQAIGRARSRYKAAHPQA
jgi:inorganic pyrophosphatase